MKTLLFLSFLSSFITLAQQKNVMVKAKETLSKFYIDGKPDHNNSTWTIMPDVNPDIYYYPKGTKKITFVTDIDTATFSVKGNKTIDFIVLLNGIDSAFTQLKMEETIDYMGILKNAKKYNVKDHKVLPPFTYQDSSNADLVKLRKFYNLDSIAGQGNEISQILNLLHWIHNSVSHDGQRGNPDIKNALYMIEVCKKEKRGLNCRGLAISLNECYLAMGFKARFLTCMPKDSIFNDCHVINTVYSQDLQKWIYLDPTHDAYVMNEYGILLSVEEVRERIINGKPLILNPTANWNYKESTMKETYLYNYMAKNLYRIESPLHSKFNVETFTELNESETIELIPLDGLIQKNEFFKDSNKIFNHYKTNNPSLFWMKP